MSIFLAWIIVGFCAAMLVNNRAYSVMGKYCFGIHLMSDFEKRGAPAFSTDPEDIQHWNKVAAIATYIVGVLLAPVVLYSAIKVSLIKEPFAKMKAQNDEFVKRHGMIF